MAEVIEYDNVAMLATARCDRCGAPAQVEVQLPGDGVPPLLFCGHDYARSEEALRKIDGAMIADHRPFLNAQEEEFKKQPSR